MWRFYCWSSILVIRNSQVFVVSKAICVMEFFSINSPHSAFRSNYILGSPSLISIDCYRQFLSVTNHISSQSVAAYPKIQFLFQLYFFWTFTNLFSAISHFLHSYTDDCTLHSNLHPPQPIFNDELNNNQRLYCMHLLKDI